MMRTAKVPTLPLPKVAVQAANYTRGIKHIYRTLTVLWKFFNYSPKRTVS